MNIIEQPRCSFKNEFKMKRFYKYMAVAIAAVGVSSCSNDWLDREPSTSIPTEKAITSYYDLVTAQNGMYDGLQEDQNYYGARMFYYGDVRGDDMQSTAPGKRTHPLYEMNYTVETAPEMWATPYNVIRRANNIIKAVENGQVKDGVAANINDIVGQAYAVRALVLFDLTRVYSQPYYVSNGAGLGVPIVLTPGGYTAKVGRSTLKECYDQIIADLNKSVTLLASSKKVGYINSWAAKALLSRVYLYKADYANAYTTAVDVITKSPYRLWTNSEYVNAWSSAGNSELLFEIVNKGSDDWVDREAIGYLLAEKGYDDYIITKNFYDLVNQNPNDVRLGMFTIPATLDKNGKKKINGVDVTGMKIYLTKFPGRADFSPNDVRVNNIPVLRLSEIYLIAAEAALQGGATAADATKYLDAIVNRADNATHVVEADVTLDRILKERRLELVGEGQRFFDAMRTGKTITRYTGAADKGWHSTLPDMKSASFDNTYYRAILPIPKVEVDANPLIKDQQNKGY